MPVTALTALLSVLGFWAVVAVAQVGTGEPEAPEPLTVEALQQQVRNAAGLDAREPRSAHALLQAALAAPVFAELTAEEQGQVLAYAARAAIMVEEYDLAAELSLQATEAAPLNGLAWLVRTVAASVSSNWPDAVRSMTQMLRTSPSQLSHLSETAIASALFNAARTVDETETFYELFDLLHAAGGVPCSRDGEPEFRCADVAALWLDRNEPERAWSAAARVTNPYVVIAMRADRRFDPLLAAHPEHFDVDRAIERYLTLTRAAMDQDPRSVSAVTRHGDALLMANRPAEVVRLIRRAMSTLGRNRGAARITPHYWDSGPQNPWLYDTRAWAFEALGRHRHAHADRQRARQRGAGRTDAVSFDINFAMYLLRRDQPEEALAVLPEPQQASAYGRVLIAYAQLQAAVQLNQAAGIDAALAYLRENREVRPSILQSALVRAGEINEAEQYFLSRLEDPVLRADALLSVQNFVRPDSAGAETENSEWEEFVSRPEIQRAIAQVGRIETYALPARVSR